MLDSNFLERRHNVLNYAKSLADDYVGASQVGIISENELARVVSLSAIVFACIQFRAENVSQVKFIAYDGEKPLDAWHPAQRTVADISDWLMETENALCIYGDSLSQIILNKHNLPLKLAFINNQLWSVNTYGRARGSVVYRVNPYSGNYDMDGVDSTELSTNAVVYLRNAIDPYTDYAGIAPLEAAYLSAATGVEISQTQLFTFINRAIPAMMVQPAVEQPQNQQFNFREAALSLVEAFRRLVSGSRHAGKTFVASERWEVQELQSTFKDLDMSGLRTDEIRQVLTAFRVYESLILAGSSNYATAVQEATNWADSWLLPRTKRIGERIAKQLQPYCYDVTNLRIVPDESTIPFLENKRAAQLDTYEKMVKTAAIDLYTYQEFLGVEPREEFKDYFYYEGKGWIDAKRWANVWSYGLLIAPSTRNAGLIPDDEIPFDPQSTETALNQLEAQAETIVAEAEADAAEAEAQVSEAEAEAISEGVQDAKVKAAWTDDAISAAQRELKQFSKFVQSKGVKSSGDFVFEFVPENVVTRVKSRMASEVDTPYGDIFEEGRNWIEDATKSAQSIRLNFENAMEDLIVAARNRDINKRRFGTALRNLIRVSGTSLYTEGLIVGGVADGTLSDEDTGEINRLIVSQSQYVTDLGDQIFGDGITDTQANQKPAMWFSKSLNPFYDAGMASAAGNANFEWVYGDTDHCKTCKNANGQIHRLKSWRESGILPGADSLDCRGFNCKCHLIRTASRARGRLSSLKSHDHDDDLHNHDE